VHSGVSLYVPRFGYEDSSSFLKHKAKAVATQAALLSLKKVTRSDPQAK